MTPLSPQELLGAIDVLAEHVHGALLTLDRQEQEIAQQRMDLTMTAQHLASLRGQVTAFSLERERHTPRNVDTHGLIARVSGGARRTVRAS